MAVAAFLLASTRQRWTCCGVLMLASVVMFFALNYEQLTPMLYVAHVVLGMDTLEATGP